MSRPRRAAVLGVGMVTLTALALSGCSRGGTSDSAGSSGGSGGSGGKSYTIRFAVGQVKGTPVANAALSFKEQVESATKGRIKVNVYNSGELGSNEDVMEQVHGGSVQMFTVDPGFLAPYYEAAQFSTLPFLFKNTDEAYGYWDGSTGKKEKDAILAHTGLRVLNAEEFGFHNLVNSKRPINTIADVKGLKFEATDSPVDIMTYKALGIHAVVTSLSETYTALQQGVIDGIDLGFGSLLAQKQYEVAKYIAVTNDSYSTGLTFVNEKFFQTLSADDQKLVTETAAKIEGPERDAQKKADADAETFIRDHGGVVTTPSTEALSEFQNAMKPIYDDLEKLIGADAVTWYNEYKSGQ